MPGWRAETLQAGSIVVLHNFVPLVISPQSTVHSQVIVTIFFIEAIVPLVHRSWNQCSVIQISRHPALGADLDGLISLVVAHIGEQVAAYEGGCSHDLEHA